MVEGWAKGEPFFVTVNLRRRVKPFDRPEYVILIDALQGARRWWRRARCKPITCIWQRGIGPEQEPTVRKSLTVATCWLERNTLWV